MAAKRRGVKEGSRLARGRADADARFPVAPANAALPRDYTDALGVIKQRIQEERLRVVLSANAAMVVLYWDIGRMILDRQDRSGWGAKIIDRLAADLREAFPDMKGFSPRNLLFMRSFAEACPDAEKVKQLVSQLPWGHIIRLLQRVKSPEIREWYIRKSIEHGWSRSILELQIDGGAHQRQGKAISNFRDTLPPTESDLAAQVFKDPYLFDFLGTADPRREREIEQALVDHIQRFLLELGSGFAFVGRQVPLEVGDQDFQIDLLFYHLKLRCYVVIELKAVPFEPAFVGQLNLYLSAADDLLSHPDDKPTIGLLLCRSKDKIVVEYALRDLKKPIGVAGWETKLVDKLPKALKGSLPTVEEIEAELSGELRQTPQSRR
jgi:predicted nuclease of restriction endonuclease-like (RecB) superfamily